MSVSSDPLQGLSVPSQPDHDSRPPIFLMTNNFETGGSERQFTLVARALRQGAYRINLGCLNRRGRFLGDMGEVAEFDLGGSFCTLQAQRARLRLSRHLRAQQIAIAHSFDFYSNLMLIPTARLSGIPVVIGSQRQLGDLLTPLQFGIQAAGFRMCDRVVCNSHAASRRLILDGLDERKIVIIPNGISDEAFAKTPPALPRVPGLVRIGVIARMNNPVKNFEAILDAAAKLAPKYSMLEFLLVGDGPLRSTLERTVETRGLKNRIKLLGERKDIPAFLAAIDICVHPSSSESLSNSILESMAAGKPVVAFRVGGNPELIRDGETGLLAPRDNEDRFVGALEYLINQPSAREEFGQRARAVAREKYSIKHICDQFEGLYTDLLEEKTWRPRWRRSLPREATASTLPLRVAIIAPSSRWIGGQSVQANLLEHHWRDDSEVEIRRVAVDPEMPWWLAWIEKIPYLRTMVREPFYLASLWRGIRDVEILHVFSASYWSFVLAPLPACCLGWLRRKSVLVNYHSGEARDHLRRSKIAAPFLSRAEMVVVPSMYLAEVFREFGISARVVPNTVDLGQFPYRVRRFLRPFLICTRGFDPYYGVDLVVQAFARVKEEHPEAKLDLVGKGAMEESIRALVQQLNVTSVDFTGPVAHQDIRRFYEQSDIFINASWLDNMPLSILEAFASGMPVVSTAPEGIRYLVEHERTGLLCAPGDWQALAENVLRLTREPSLGLELTRNAYEEARRYRWEVVRGQWLAAYRELRQFQGTVLDKAHGNVESVLGTHKSPASPEATQGEVTRFSGQ